MKLTIIGLAALAFAGTSVTPGSWQHGPPAQTAPALPAAPAVQVAPSAQAATLAEGALPGTNDPTWEPVFTDDFRQPYDVANLGGVSVFTVKQGDVETPVWKNVGNRPMNQCASVDPKPPGILTLKARHNKDSKNKNTVWQCRITSMNFIDPGARILAARIKVHTSTGHLSSFWANGSPYNEIDVIENAGLMHSLVGCKATKTVRTNVDGTNHKDGPYYGLNHTYYSSPKPKTGNKYCLPEADARPLQDDKFHIFHVEFVPGQHVKFYTDGKLSAKFGGKYAIDTPLEIILTNILKKDGPQGKDFEVDWVKVWKKRVPASDAYPAPAPTCADNDCWRAQLGVYQGYKFRANSNMSDPRLAQIIFDRQFYLDSYPDVLSWAEGKVRTQGGTIYKHAEWHWLHYGIPWGRMGSATFDPTYYMNAQPDVAAAYGWNNYAGAIDHYLVHGRFEGRRASVFFDPAHYKARYGDVAGAANYDVVDHFTVFGMDEGRQGSADFAPAWYMAANPDLRAAFGNNYYRRGMSHWISNGRAEGRPGKP